MVIGYLKEDIPDFYIYYRGEKEKNFVFLILEIYLFL